MNGIFAVMLLTAVVVPNHAIYPGFLTYSPPTLPYPYAPIQRPISAEPLFAYTVHTTVPTSASSKLATSEFHSFYSPTDKKYQGFSYQTNYEDGGNSAIIFATGPEAEEIMKKSMELLTNIIPMGFGRILPADASGTNSTNASSTAASRIYPNNAFSFMSHTPVLHDIINSFVYTIIDENTSTSNIAEEAQESMIHGDIADSPDINENINLNTTNNDSDSSATSDDNGSSATSDDSSSSSTSDIISISTITTTTTTTSITGIAANPPTTSMMPTTSNTFTMTSTDIIPQNTTTTSSLVISEDESNDIIRTTEISNSLETSPDSVKTTAAPTSDVLITTDMMETI